LTQLGRFIACRSTPHSIFYRSRINDARQVEDLHRSPPLPLSHSTELECMLFRAASPISRHPLQLADTFGCWQMIFHESKYVHAFQMNNLNESLMHILRLRIFVFVAQPADSYCTSQSDIRCTTARVSQQHVLSLKDPCSLFSDSTNSST
jgi:hypothetical protein